jgi:cardiolipin synthase
MGLVAGMLFLALFRPALRYEISTALDLTSEDCLAQLEVLGNAKMYRHNTIEVLTDGATFYEAEIEAIQRAKHSVQLEAYIFQEGDVAGRLKDALAERSQRGVEVKVLLDALGSLAARV